MFRQYFPPFFRRTIDNISFKQTMKWVGILESSEEGFPSPPSSTLSSLNLSYNTLHFSLCILYTTTFKSVERTQQKWSKKFINLEHSQNPNYLDLKKAWHKNKATRTQSIPIPISTTSLTSAGVNAG
jgi:hypothetical protein